MPHPPRPRSILSAVALAVCWVTLAGGCGGSGTRETQPIEVIFFVDGPEGARFRVEAIHAANADHRFGEREFAAPHFFVLENARQPVRGWFEPLDDPIRVTVALGAPTTALGSEGETRTISPGDEDRSVGTGHPSPEPSGPEVRFEVTAGDDGAHVGFTATVGDRNATVITSCVLPPAIAPNCFTPATFFIENPRGTVSGLFTKFASENPDIAIRADLIVDGSLRDTDSGRQDAVVSVDL